MIKPYVIINCAMSADGKIALPTGRQLRISCDLDIERMHKLRNECDAILVGINTVLSDDPKLTVKKRYVSHPKQPLRVVLDRECKIPTNAQILNRSAKTLIITSKACDNQLTNDHVEIVKCSIDTDGYIDLEEVLALLYKKGVKKLLVEGGGTVIWNFLRKKFVDDLYLFIGPCIIGGKNTPTLADGIGITHPKELIKLRVIQLSRFGTGVLIHYRMEK